MNDIINTFDLFMFDLDDTLVKTEQYHYAAWLITLNHFIDNDYYISEHDFYKIFHSDTPNNINIYLETLLKLTNVSHIIEYKNNIYYDLIIDNKNNIEMVEGCKEFINNLIIKNKDFVIVSNSLKEHIIFFQELFPILQYSKRIYYREMFKNKKPDPECYIRVLNDFPNRKSVCFEDSLTGIKAASQVEDIMVVYINSSKYPHHYNILSNYKVFNIISYNELL